MHRITLLVVAAASSLALGDASAQAQAGEARGTGGGSFVLELSAPQSATAWVSKASGGYAYGEVVDGAVGPDNVQRKHIAAVKYEPLVVRTDPGSVGGLLAAALKTPATISGGLLTVENGGKITGEVHFSNALVSRIVIPALDASSKAPCAVDVSFDLGNAATVSRSGDAHRSPNADGECVAGQFQISIPGLDDAMRHVTHVDTIVMSRPTVSTPLGGSHDLSLHPTRWSAHDVTVTLPAANSAALYSWYKDFVIDGRNVGNDKTLDLHLRAANGRDALTLHATGVGVVSVHPASAQGDKPLVQAEFFVEQWQVHSSTP